MTIKKIYKKIDGFCYHKPEIAAVIPTAILVITLTILSIVNLPEKTIESIIFTVFLMVFLVGGLFFWIFLMVFGERKQHDDRQEALNHELEVMINQALIENGSITKPEEMVRLS